MADTAYPPVLRADMLSRATHPEGSGTGRVNGRSGGLPSEG